LRAFTEDEILIPYKEIREDDLKVGVRVWVMWPPGTKPDAAGQITEVREWPGIRKIRTMAAISSFMSSTNVPASTAKHRSLMNGSTYFDLGTATGNSHHSPVTTCSCVPACVGVHAGFSAISNFTTETGPDLGQTAIQIRQLSELLASSRADKGGVPSFNVAT